MYQISCATRSGTSVHVGLLQFYDRPIYIISNFGSGFFVLAKTIRQIDQAMKRCKNVWLVTWVILARRGEIMHGLPTVFQPVIVQAFSGSARYMPSRHLPDYAALFLSWFPSAGYPFICVHSEFT